MNKPLVVLSDITLHGICTMQVVRLVELLDEAKERCVATIKERRPDISDEELDMASSAMGYGAVKYADLKSNRTTNYRFSYDEMLSLQGNTAVYLLYAHARIASIVRKSGKDMIELAKTAKIVLKHEKEIALAVHIGRFPGECDFLGVYMQQTIGEECLSAHLPSLIIYVQRLLRTC